MFDLPQITTDYLDKLINFLYEFSWMYKILNTQYVKEDVLVDNFNYLNLMQSVDLNEFVSLHQPQNNHPIELQKLIEKVNYFRINYEIINTEDWICKKQQKRMSVKKLYEIENMSELINDICKDEVSTLVDLGSGLGYVDEALAKFGYKIIGLEGSENNQHRAVMRQQKYYPESINRVKHIQHFITLDSADFINSQIDDDESKIALFGLHPCGDLSIVSIKLFLEMPRVKKLIIAPCCYHKMSARDDDNDKFNFFPLCQTVCKITSKFSENPFSRPFLRLAGQQSPKKFTEMSDEDHYLHGKNMFERSVVEAILNENETSKRVDNTSFAQGRVKFDDLKLKYQIIDKNTLENLPWNEDHQARFNEIREKLPNGEEMSENLFCLQTTIQNSCENLVIMDRVFYIYEQMRAMKIDLSVKIKKLQNEKLSPRCLILIVEKR